MKVIQSNKENSARELSNKISEIERLLREAEEFANENDLIFSFDLKNLESTYHPTGHWNSSSGSCGWKNESDIEPGKYKSVEKEPYVNDWQSSSTDC